MDPSVFAPLVRFGREPCGDPAADLRRECLLTNGLGGYAQAWGVAEVLRTIRLTT